MSMRQVVRWAAMGISTIVFIPIIILNVEKLAENKKWDQFLTTWWPTVSESLIWANSTWFLCIAAFIGGATVALWVDFFLRRKEKHGESNEFFPNNVDIRLRFFGDSRPPEFVSGDNCWRWYVLNNMQVTFDGNVVGESKILSTCVFISFDLPVQASQLLVKSSDFQLPLYEVKDFSERHVIIALQGCVPAGVLEISTVK